MSGAKPKDIIRGCLIFPEFVGPRQERKRVFARRRSCARSQDRFLPGPQRPDGGSMSFADRLATAITEAHPSQFDHLARIMHAYRERRRFSAAVPRLFLICDGIDAHHRSGGMLDCKVERFVGCGEGFRSGGRCRPAVHVTRWGMRARATLMTACAGHDVGRWSWRTSADAEASQRIGSCGGGRGRDKAHPRPPRRE